MKNKISCLVPVYNEAKRIRTALAGLVPWAEEVIVCDKQSTDGTPELACAVASNVRVVAIPYSDRGCENHAELLRLAAHDWIYLGTCAEVPTRALVEEMDRVLTEQGDRLDVVTVPRRMYSMGAHADVSAWSISQYPFLMHRDRVVTPGILHDHFRARSRGQQFDIAYRPDCCVHHYTHASFDAFVSMHLNYAVHEAAALTSEAHFDRLCEGLRALLPSLCHDRTVQVHGMGYAIYSFLICLKRYEIDMGGPWPAAYAADAARVLEREWQIRADHSGMGVVPICESASRMSLRATLYRKGIVLLLLLLMRLARRSAKLSRSGAGGT